MELKKEKLLIRLEAFELTPSGAALTFERRLARENGWSPAYAERVVKEYRRFLYLAMRAGHPVTPSEAVDQAWHLHLVYTESYWNDLCRDLLGQPLHHGPTRGGAREQAKYEDWYERTRESYRRLLASEPPADIWPDASERFGEAPFYQRINLRRNWLIPKPDVGRWLSGIARSAGSRLGRWRRSGTSGWGFGAAATAVLAGCTAGGGNGWNVFDWYGPPFLGFYLGLSVLLAGTAYYFRRRTADGESAGEGIAELEVDPYQVAFLAGGPQAAVQAAVVALREQGLVALEGERPVRIAAVATLTPSHLAPFERIVLAAAQPSPSFPELLRSVKDTTAEWESTLVADGLMLSHENRLRLKTLGGLLLTVGWFVGALKVFIGVQRDRPVLFLVLAMVVLTVTLLGITHGLPRWSTRGKALLARLRSEYQHFSRGCLQQVRQEGAIGGVGGGALAMLPLAVGLYGLDALGDTAELQTYRRLWPPGTQTGSGSDGGGGCGTSTGTGSSGGSDGGGDGGGSGCGGCGGGGD